MSVPDKALSAGYRIGEFAGGAVTEWQAEVSRLHGRFTVSAPGDDYTGRLRWQATQRHRLVEWMGSPERLVRDRAAISGDEQDTVEIVAVTSGRLIVEQAGRRIRLSPGEIAVVPLDRPILCEHTEISGAISLLAPASSVQHLLPSAGSLVVDGRVGLAGVAFSMLTALTEQRTALAVRGFESACERVFDLCALASTEAAVDADEHRDAVAQAVRHYIHDHAGDPDLSVTVIAAAIGWSVRHVQSVMRASGSTVSELIRARRLELAYSALTNPRFANTSLTAVSALCGFAAYPVFCRAVRSRYGMTPTDLRRSARV